MLVEGAKREYRKWDLDSRHWRHYRPRPDDIIIATYPKCGTTWMQRIVGMLIFESPRPMPLMTVSLWVDRRFPTPIEEDIARIEAQEHRRFLKAHLPRDGLPFYDDVKYIHVARDGRDACMSLHNHCRSFTDQILQYFNSVGLADETVGRPYPAIADDPAEFFRRWIRNGEAPGAADGSPSLSFFQFENSWWEARARPNVLLVHYNDLKKDLDGEMRRVADFLGISIAPGLWPQLVDAASFAAMRREGDALLPLGGSFKGGSRGFLFKGTNGRWRGVVADDDLQLYEAKVKAMLPPVCARWVERGRLEVGDPGLAHD